jgi:caffeoyl-CoA O-methyltransferase
LITLNPEGIYEYAVSKAEPTEALLDELIVETKARMKNWVMLCGPLEGRFLKLMVQISQATKIIEIGTFTGYSALSMAEALPENGRLTTLDIDPDTTAFAKSYFDRSKHGRKIDSILGPALESLKSLSGPFDLAFIDADKPNYPHYYEAVLPKLKSGGIILIDNVLWGGAVLDPTTVDDIAITTLNDIIAKDERVDRVLLTIRDGLFLVRKR